MQPREVFVDDLEAALAWRRAEAELRAARSAARAAEREYLLREAALRRQPKVLVRTERGVIIWEHARLDAPERVPDSSMLLFPEAIDPAQVTALRRAIVEGRNHDGDLSPYERVSVRYSAGDDRFDPKPVCGLSVPTREGAETENYFIMSRETALKFCDLLLAPPAVSGGTPAAQSAGAGAGGSIGSA